MLLKQGNHKAQMMERNMLTFHLIPEQYLGKSDDEEKIQVGTTNDDGTNWAEELFGQPGEQPAQDRTRNDDGSDSEVPCKESGEDEAQDGTTNDGDY